MGTRIIFLSTVLTIACCFVAMYLFNLPAILPAFNLSNAGNVGSAIGGITAPIIGIFTSILLFITLKYQVHITIDQRQKSEVDFLFQLYNQFDSELSRFITIRTERPPKEAPKEIRKYGLEGLNTFAGEFKEEAEAFDFPFFDFYEAGQILQILESYSLLIDRLELSDLKPATKSAMRAKCWHAYLYLLMSPVNMIISTAIKYPLVHDWCIIKMETINSKVTDWSRHHQIEPLNTIASTR